jgi:hypothetical protein
MSTPAPPNSRLEGLELYAPRRLRMAFPPQGQAQSPLAATDEQSDGAEDAPAMIDTDVAQLARGRLDDAIKAALELRRPDDEALPDSYGERLPPAPDLDLPQGEGADGQAWSEPVPMPPPPWKTARSTPPRPRLDPEMVPEPMEHRESIMPVAVRVALVFGLAASAAFGITMLSSRQQSSDVAKPLGDRVATARAAAPASAIAPQSQPRLMVKNGTALANQPLPLGLSVQRATGDESVLVAGLAAGTRLSAGTPAGESGWRLRTADLDRVYVYAPQGFVGVMNTAFDLLSPSERLMDSRAAQLAWVSATARSAKPASRGDMKRPAAVAVAVDKMDPDEAANLMKQGEDFLQLGDISAARLAFRRLADSGRADAALALGKTFDPAYLAEHNVIGIAGDKATAREWYERAKEMGSTDANRILALTAAK